MPKMFVSEGWMSVESKPKKYLYLSIGAATLLLGALALWLLVPSAEEPPLVPQEMVGEPLTLEVVNTPDTLTKGLSGRTSIDEGYGMLFIFDRKDRHGFWMKDMQISLDIFWLSDEGIILGIEKNVGPSTYPTVFYPNEPVRYVLETRAGHADALSLSVGDQMPGVLLSDHIKR